MEKIFKLEDLFIEQMRDRLSSTELQVNFLEKINKNAESKKLKEILTKAIQLNKKHTKCLQQIFRILEKKPGGKSCETTKGLIHSASELISRSENEQLMDISSIISTQQINHHNIASFMNCKILAKQLGYDDFTEVLHEMLSEEREMDQKLTDMVASHINFYKTKPIEEI